MNSKDPRTILTTIFNHSSFRPQQEKIIENVLAGKNTLAILPTGAGKSLCFQIPALVFDGLTVVVSPLIALMKDQVDNLRRRGVLDAAYINSMLDQRKKERIYELLKESKLKMLYVAPETFVDNKLMSILKSCTISLIAIDEVHCISIWGHNFRPDYLRLKKIIRTLHEPPILGLTATATKTVEEDIQVQLGVTCDAFKDSFDRKNFLFSVLTVKSSRVKEEFLKGLLENLTGSAIVYVNFTKTAEELAGYLTKEGLSASFYHGQMEKEERKKVQNEFMRGETKIIAATSAFGMGIDKEDIRTIIHFNLPKSIEAYYQEVGRAGRDGNISNCILLYSEGDEIKLRKLITWNTPEAKQIKAVLDLLQRYGGNLIYVNAKRLANTLGLDEVSVRLMLHHLEEKGAIKTHFKIFRRAKIRLTDTDLDGRAEVERIVRSRYFIEHKWMDLKELGAALGMSIARINWLFRNLEAAGKIELAESDVCIPVHIKSGIAGIDVGEIQDMFLELERSGLKKIDRVVEYVHSVECRRRFILRYFGEDYNRLCNACDRCNPFLKLGAEGEERKEEFVDARYKAETGDELREELDKSTEIASVIFELLKELAFHPGRTFLANVLIGSKSKRIVTQNLHESRYYGILKEYTADGVKSITDQLIEQGYVEKREGDSQFPRPLLYLTDKAERALKEKESIQLRLPVEAAGAIGDGKSLELFNELKEWRRDVATHKKIPPYCVFHDSTLIGIANQLPKTKKELEGIKGIGRRRIEAYGDEILRIVNGN
jgi:ATP-dependent DNA helicase RecQ